MSIQDPVWIYYKHQTVKPAHLTDRAGAQYLVSIGLGTLNERQTRLKLKYTEGDPEIRFIDGDPDRFPRYHRAESLRVGVPTMNKAAIDNNPFHQMLAAAYRDSLDKAGR